MFRVRAFDEVLFGTKTLSKVGNCYTNLLDFLLVVVRGSFGAHYVYFAGEKLLLSATLSTGVSFTVL
jgi:hypothetical protein